ncbi:energy transducer TonB [Siccationidurans soli]|uniref:Energy transducer TonB n=2 Tax=Hymenobacter negativus TaxID=2795026 RepID=A0ABS3QIT0_9BACT|nr:energy transducer TonB [Hymenobacter negativus]
MPLAQPDESASPALFTSCFLALDGTVLPTAEGALHRRETEELGSITETRLFRLGHERLAQRTRKGLDAAGQPFESRETFLPWGQPKVRVTTSVVNGVRCVDYQTFFDNGELKMHKRREGNLLTERFVSVPNPNYSYKEEMPQYEGGANQSIVAAIQQSTKYPPMSLRNQESGRVYVSFEVRHDGLVDAICVVKGVTPALDAAALEAVRSVSLKRWRPGFQDRRAVKVVLTVPITFSIR